jgi:diguanylate cyclase (GGDEF)-like protein
VRFRHKLSIVLVALTLLPLVGAGVLVQSLLVRIHTTQVEGDLETELAGAVAAYRAEADRVAALARETALRPDVQRAFARRSGEGLTFPGAGGVEVELRDRQGVIAGDRPAAPAYRAVVDVGARNDRKVIAWLPLDERLLGRIAAGIAHQDDVGLALVVGDRAVATTSGPAGAADELPLGEPGDTSIGGRDVRALAVGLFSSRGRPVSLAATYPSDRLASEVRDLRLRVLVPAVVLAVLVGVLALITADRISRALSELAGRALALARGGDEEDVPLRGDELTELNVVLDRMASELSNRMSELESERERLKRTLARYGETLAATHDMRALLGAVLDTAVQATRARGGRLMLYDPDRAEADEQVRLGSARGSRADLPVVIGLGSGLEGAALEAREPRVAGEPRALASVPIVREEELLGLITVVDPEGGRFAADDVQTLAGLAGQAGVAIENARLHRVVEQQAVSDPLTGIANRRQFFDVLGREYERAQRFGQPLALILTDIDNFKSINDTRGHLTGDAVLRGVAATLAGLIREIDVAARYGGEEFAVLLPQTSRDGAMQLAERLRAAVEAAGIETPEGDALHVTASFGVASGPDPAMTQVDLIASADAALYEAKRAGKNVVVSAAGVTPAAPDGL